MNIGEISLSKKKWYCNASTLNNRNVS